MGSAKWGDKVNCHSSKCGVWSVGKPDSHLTLASPRGRRRIGSPRWAYCQVRGIDYSGMRLSSPYTGLLIG
jgi:hypothetical protein